MLDNNKFSTERKNNVLSKKELIYFYGGLILSFFLCPFLYYIAGNYRFAWKSRLFIGDYFNIYIDEDDVTIALRILVSIFILLTIILLKQLNSISQYRYLLKGFLSGLLLLFVVIFIIFFINPWFFLLILGL
jgi:hypothetical protein